MKLLNVQLKKIFLKNTLRSSINEAKRSIT